MQADSNANGTAPSMPVPLSSLEAAAWISNGAVVVDIRPDFEVNYRVFDVPAVYFLPYHSYREQASLLPHDVPLVVADNVGTKGREVALFLCRQGFSRVAYMAGGVVAWAQEGFPLIRDAGYELVGGCACKLRPRKPRPGGSSVAPAPGGEHETL